MSFALSHSFVYPRPPGRTLGQSVGFIVDAMRRGLSVHPRMPQAIDLMLVLMLSRLAALVRQFAAIEARFLAGKAPIVRRAPTPSLKPRPPPKPHGTPRGFGWLLKLLTSPSNVAVAGEMLRLLMQDPEMVALIAAHPRAARVLRPLFRMLAVPFPAGPKRPRRAKPQPEPPEPEALEPRAARVAPEPSPPPAKPRRAPRRRIPFALRRSRSRPKVRASQARLYCSG